VYVKEYLKRKIRGVYVAVGLHPPRLKEITELHINSGGMHGATIKPAGKFLKPWWKVSCSARPISTRFIPPIEDLAVFKEAHGKPFVVFRSVTLPTNEVTAAT
jgi:hypothetical protein